MKPEIKERVEKIRKGEVPEGYKKTKVGIIPEEWDIKELSFLAKITMGQSPDSSFYNNQEIGIPLIQGNADIKNRITSPKMFTSQITKTCDVGDIIMSVRAPVGDISKSIHKACMGRGVCSIKSLSDDDYLYHYLLFVEKKWIKLAQGSTFEAVNSDDIKRYNICFPLKSEEQEKIAEILSTWDKAIELKEKLIEEKKVQKENNLRNIFSEKFLKNNFEIKKIQLKDILKQVKEIHYIEEDKLYRQVTISKNGKVSFRGEKPGNKIGRKRQFKINLDKHPESLIFIRQGVLNGGIGIIPKEVNCCVVTENMPMFRIVDIDVTYLKWLIKSPLFRNRIKKIIPDGTAQKAIHEKVLLLESFIIPKDIKDQKIIADIVSLQFNEIELLESELEQTKEQKRGLMQLLLTGIVRVEVD